MPSKLEYFDDWPSIVSRLGKNAEVEAAVQAILDQMTLEEKVGQMIQPELYELTPQEAGEYKFGSALNGAGICPNGDRYASQADWVEAVDAYWMAVDAAFKDRPFRIPFMWATDAVHGHNNLFRATIYPHNVGLGSSDDPDLVRRIGEATAREIAATAMDWTFAPTVTVPRDYRWGRHFEGYSEDPAIIHGYAAAMVEGLQGRPEQDELRSPDRVIACVKHWVADGGTLYGVDRGDCYSEEAVIRNIHAPGYFAGLEAGAQSVMISFSGWRHPRNYDHSPWLEGAYNHKLCGSRYLITDVLKDRMGFDGVVITDWEAHAEVSRCTLGDAGFAINAGADVLMVSARTAWRSIFHTTLKQVREGLIPQARIDDAVSRVLRVKMRAGLWDKPRPRERPLARLPDQLGRADHRALAREAARKSLVLLKNNGQALPLSPKARVLVTGTAARDIQKLTGGWTLSWQGADVSIDDFPGAVTLAGAVEALVGSARCVVDPRLEATDPADFDVVIVALGEDAYAEMRGTIRPWRTLEYAVLKQSYADDLNVLRRLRAARNAAGAGPTVVSLFFSGRPLYVTEEVNLSDAFVAAWLPGPNAEGVTDVLFADGDGEVRHDFTGKLRFSWPAKKTSYAINTRAAHMPPDVTPIGEQAPEGEHAPLFAYGHGLSYADGERPDLEALALDEAIDQTPLPPLDSGFDILSAKARDRFDWVFKGHNTWTGEPVRFDAELDKLIMNVRPVDLKASGDALRLRFKGFPAFIYAQYPTDELKDLRAYVEAAAHFEMQINLHAPPTGPVFVACHDDYPSQPAVDISARLKQLSPGWSPLRLSLRELRDAGVSFRTVNTPFMIYSDFEVDFSIGEIRLVTPAATDAAEFPVSSPDGGQ